MCPDTSIIPLHYMCTFVSSNFSLNRWEYMWVALVRVTPEQDWSGVYAGVLLVAEGNLRLGRASLKRVLTMTAVAVTGVFEYIPYVLHNVTILVFHVHWTRLHDLTFFPCFFFHLYFLLFPHPLFYVDISQFVFWQYCVHGYGKGLLGSFFYLLLLHSMEKQRNDLASSTARSYI